MQPDVRTGGPSAYGLACWPRTHERTLANIALISGPDAGHLLPIVSLAVALQRRGHRCLVATGPDLQRSIETEGLDFQLLPLLQPADRDLEIGFRIWDRAAEMAPPLAAQLRLFEPEAVVTDTLTAAGGFAADLLGVPWAELSPHHLMDPSPHVPPVGMGKRPSRALWRRLWYWDVRRQQRASLAAGAAERDAARASIGLGVPWRPRARMLSTLPGLEHPRPDWPDDAYVVGAMVWEPDAWPALEPPPGDEPLVVVTDSTASGVSASLAEIAIAGLADEPVRLVVTTSRDLDAPSSVVVGRGRHLPLLRRAAAAVGFGGHGFVTKALACAVPLVVLPLQGDQPETAGRLTLADGGVSLRLADLTPRRIRRAVRTVLRDPRYAAGANRLARDAARLGPDYAARVVERTLLS